MPLNEGRLSIVDRGRRDCQTDAKFEFHGSTDISRHLPPSHERRQFFACSSHAWPSW